MVAAVVVVVVVVAVAVVVIKLHWMTSQSLLPVHKCGINCRLCLFSERLHLIQPSVDRVCGA